MIMIYMNSLRADERLIVALDVPDAAAALAMVEALDGVASFFKIGLELFTAAGPALVEVLIRRNKRIFLDLKFFDVPETVRRATAAAAALGVDLLTVHEAGPTVRAAVEGRGDRRLKILAVTLLTSMGPEDLAAMGYQGTPEALVLERARRAEAAGADGVIASPAELASLRRQVHPGFLIVTPGIRPAGSATQDHQRLGTPAEAIRAGADYLVVGRPIRDAQTGPRQAAQAILAEMSAAR